MAQDRFLGCPQGRTGLDPRLREPLTGLLVEREGLGLAACQEEGGHRQDDEPLPMRGTSAGGQHVGDGLQPAGGQVDREAQLQACVSALDQPAGDGVIAEVQAGERLAAPQAQRGIDELARPSGIVVTQLLGADCEGLEAVGVNLADGCLETVTVRHRRDPARQ